MQAGLDTAYAPAIVLFTWAGVDGMDEVTGTGSAEPLDGSLEIEFEYLHGDEAILKAGRDSSSTAC